ncbi:MAG: hypothetical protein WC673_00660 [Candidatus Paceibacterota bacterium]|jgi:hypothetical protein
MSIWSAKRKFFYFAGATLFVLLFVGLPIFLLVYRVPTCSDGKQNQGETGIDCGGSCRAVCASVAIEPIVWWQRFFQISPGVYNTVARVENPNTDSAVARAKYIFRLYDKANAVIAWREGETNIPPHQIFYIFEGSLSTGERLPVKATFEFVAPLNWVVEKTLTPLSVTGQILSKTSTVPRLDAILRNNSDNDVHDVELVAVIFDADGNAINASKTVIDAVLSESAVPFFFTWRQPFDKEPTRVEIIPRLK